MAGGVSPPAIARSQGDVFRSAAHGPAWQAAATGPAQKNPRTR